MRSRTSLGRTVARMDKVRHGVADHPTQIVRHFRSDAMQGVNADGCSNGRYRDYNRRITWPQFTTTQRVHFHKERRTSLLGQLGREDGGTQKLGKDGKPVFDENGKPVMLRRPKAPVAVPTAEED